MVIEALPVLADWQWINHPRSHRYARWKPAQLSVARRLGFTTPQTVISNDPEEIRAFYAAADPTHLQGPFAILEPGGREGDLHRGHEPRGLGLA